MGHGAGEGLRVDVLRSAAQVEIALAAAAGRHASVLRSDPVEGTTGWATEHD
jgi:hypothetical protein